MWRNGQSARLEKQKEKKETEAQKKNHDRVHLWALCNSKTTFVLVEISIKRYS